MCPRSIKSHSGFTLAELLICLAIIAEIATFTIPKILTAQQNGKFNALAKEAMGSISQAFQLYTTQNAITASTYPEEFLSPYLGYVSIDTTGSIDNSPGASGATLTCNSANSKCYRLAGGSILRATSCAFGGTTSQYAARVTFDPDGVVTSTQDSLVFYVYATGRITTKANVDDNTLGGGTCGATWPSPTADPSWFSW